jgi:zinc transport system permease protein
MLLATLLGGVFTSAGLALAYGPDLPAGPTMILLAGITYVVSALATAMRHRRAQRRASQPRRA